MNRSYRHPELAGEEHWHRSLQGHAGRTMQASTVPAVQSQLCRCSGTPVQPVKEVEVRPGAEESQVPQLKIGPEMAQVVATLHSSTTLSTCWLGES